MKEIEDILYDIYKYKFKKTIISQTEARKQGLTFYFTNRYCKNKHKSHRYVTNNKCEKCVWAEQNE